MEILTLLMVITTERVLGDVSYVYHRSVHCLTVATSMSLMIKWTWQTFM